MPNIMFAAVIMFPFLIFLPYGCCSTDSFEKCPTDTTVKVGNKLRMGCIYNNETTDCKDRSHNWKKDGTLVNLLISSNFTKVGNSIDMSAEKDAVSIKDDAEYQCCREAHKDNCCCDKIKVTVSMPLDKLTLKLNDSVTEEVFTAQENDMIRLRCDIKEARPKPQLRWKHNSQLIDTSSYLPAVEELDGKLYDAYIQLEPKKLTDENHGDLYECEASYESYDGWKPAIKSVELDVQYSPKFDDNTLTFKTSGDKNIFLQFRSNPVLTETEVEIVSIEPNHPGGQWDMYTRLEKEDGLNQKVYLKMSDKDINSIDYLAKKYEVTVTISIKNIEKTFTITGNYSLAENKQSFHTEEPSQDEALPWYSVLLIGAAIGALVVVAVIFLRKKIRQGNKKPTSRNPESVLTMSSMPSGSRAPVQKQTEMAQPRQNYAGYHSEEPLYANEVEGETPQEVRNLYVELH